MLPTDQEIPTNKALATSINPLENDFLSWMLNRGLFKKPDNISVRFMAYLMYNSVTN